MSTARSSRSANRSQDTRKLRIPLPHEHGAWVMLYAPPAIAFACKVSSAWNPALLLIAAVTGVFLSRHVVGLLLRGRGDVHTRLWLAVYAVIAVGGAVPLFLIYRRWGLLYIGGIAAVLFATHAVLSAIPSRKRLDRSQWGELLAVGALTLTGPAAYIAVNGRFDSVAAAIWAACTLYFASGVFFVKMLLGAVKFKASFTNRERWTAGRDHLIYHSVLLAIGIASASAIGRQAPLSTTLLIVAYVPALLRAVQGWLKLSNKPPPLRKVGIAELGYAVWFSILAGLAFRQAI